MPLLWMALLILHLPPSSFGPFGLLLWCMQRALRMSYLAGVLDTHPLFTCIRCMLGRMRAPVQDSRNAQLRAARQQPLGSRTIWLMCMS